MGSSTKILSIIETMFALISLFLLAAFELPVQRHESTSLISIKMLVNDLEAEKVADHEDLAGLLRDGASSVDSDHSRPVRADAIVPLDVRRALFLAQPTDPNFTAATYQMINGAIRGVNGKSWVNTAHKAALYFDPIKRSVTFVKGDLSSHANEVCQQFGQDRDQGLYQVADKSGNHLWFQLQNGNLRVFHGSNDYIFTNQEKQVVFVRHGTSVQNTWKDFEARRNGPNIPATVANQDFPDVTNVNRRDAPLTAFFKIHGITKFAVTKWEILGHNGGAGLEAHITNNVVIHVSPHTRTLQTMILALYDIPHIEHATFVVDPRIREVRKGTAVDCVGSDSVHMAAQIDAQFAELTNWHTNNTHGINGIRNAINNDLQAALIAAVDAAETAGRITVGTGLLSLSRSWYGALETEYGRGSYFAGRSGMWPEIGTYPQSRVILFGHSSMFRAILSNMPGYKQVPEYFRTDKMINYGHLLINYAAGNGFVPENQYGIFKFAHRLQRMMAAAQANGQNNNAILAEVTRVSQNLDPLDARLKAYKDSDLIKSGQAISVFNHL